MTPPRHDVDDIFQWAREASENTKVAIARSGVRRVVLLSSMGAEFAEGTVSLTLYIERDRVA